VPRIAIIGAGSRGFGKGFVGDILQTPALAGCTLALMDVDRENLEVTATIARRLAAQLGVGATVEATTDRRAALDGADYVISTIQLYGLDVWDQPMQIARKYGVDQVVGCTTGPGAAFAMARYMPVMLAICRDMEELCPHAWLLHYANPTSAISWALNRATKTKSIGMCHSVQHTAMTLARYVGAPYEETGHWVAGINHQAWFLRFEWRGQDAYPLLRERIEDPEVDELDPVRCEVMRRFGYFSTESSCHHSEYYPYFRKNAETIARFTPRRGPMAGMGKDFDNTSRWRTMLVERGERLRAEATSPEPIALQPSSGEYVTGIINAMETNAPFRFNGNVVNTGLITNLPPGSGVEVPCLVDNMGVHPCYVGELPETCAALNRMRAAGDGLMVKATLEGDRKALEQAIALDPLTAAMLTLDQVHRMVEEIFEVQRPYMPQFA
jgi:alpha-galactosidase